MNSPLRLTVQAVALLGALSACSPSTSVSTAPPPSPVPPTETPGDTPSQPAIAPSATPTYTTVQISFDGQNCAYDGPDSMPSGSLLVTLNQSEPSRPIELGIFRLVDRKTWQDYLDYVGEPGEGAEGVHAQPWMHTLSLTFPVEDDPDAVRYPIPNAGVYGIACLLVGDVPGEILGVWPAAPFEVVDGGSD